MSKLALVIIDIQNDYFPGGRFPLENSIQAGNNAAKVLAYFRESGEPVFHIRHESIREGAFFFIPETEGVEINKCVTPNANEAIIRKNFPNSFLKTELKAELDKLEITELVIIGMMSNMCVDATTRAASDMGYKCTVVYDACCGAVLDFNGTQVGSAEVHAAFMSSLGMFYARMVSSDELTSRH